MAGTPPPPRWAAATTADKLSQPIQAPSPRRAGIKYPVRETPHSDIHISRIFKIICNYVDFVTIWPLNI